MLTWTNLIHLVSPQVEAHYDPGVNELSSETQHLELHAVEGHVPSSKAALSKGTKLHARASSSGIKAILCHYYTALLSLLYYSSVDTYIYIYTHQHTLLSPQSFQSRSGRNSIIHSMAPGTLPWAPCAEQACVAPFRQGLRLRAEGFSTCR